MEALKLYIHLIISTLIVLVIHIITPIVVLNTVARILGGPLWLQITPLISIVVGYWIAFTYLKTLKIDHPRRKALVAAITGTVLFWGSCLAFVCSLANQPMGW